MGYEVKSALTMGGQCGTFVSYIPRGIQYLKCSNQVACSSS